MQPRKNHRTTFFNQNKYIMINRCVTFIFLLCLAVTLSAQPAKVSLETQLFDLPDVVLKKSIPRTVTKLLMNSK